MRRSAIVDTHGAELEAELKRAVGDGASPLDTMVRYQMGWVDQTGAPEQRGPADRVWGALCLLAAEAVGGSASRAMPAAAAIELAAGFAAVHDAIKDGTPDDGRRPSLWWVWGHAQGINAGDALYALARLALTGLLDRGVPPETVGQASASLDRACLELCERRSLGIEAEGRWDVQGYLKVLEGTSGAVACCAARLGALAGGAAAPSVEALGQFGRNAGVAAQVRGEVQGIWRSGVEGRTRLLKALEKRRALPLLFAQSAGTGPVRAELETALRRERPLTDDDLGRLLRTLEEAGMPRLAEEEAARYHRQAVDALRQANLDPSAARPLLAFASHLAGG